MVFLNDGNMFATPEQSIQLESDNDYALVLSGEQILQDPALMHLHLDANSPNKAFAGKNLSLYTWNSEMEKLIDQSPDSVVVFRVRFFPEQN